MDAVDYKEDFNTNPYDKLPTHFIYNLNEKGLKKYLKPRNYYYNLFCQQKRDLDKRIEEHEKKQKLKQISIQPNKTLNTTLDDKPTLLTNTDLSTIQPQRLNATSDLSQPTLTQQVISQPKKISNNIKLQKKPTENFPCLNNNNFFYTNKNSVNFTRYNNSLVKAITCSSPYKNKSSGNVYEMMTEQNDELRKGLIKTLKSKKFLQSHRLPHLGFSRCIVTETNIPEGRYGNPNFNHSSYYMGERYNPLNFDLVYGKNRTKRNEFGHLFAN